jgi:hypothetical protein
VADSIPDVPSEPLRYKLLTGTGDRAFCEKVSRHLEGGYVLYGEPVIARNAFGGVTVAQAVVLRGA